MANPFQSITSQIPVPDPGWQGFPNSPSTQPTYNMIAGGVTYLFLRNWLVTVTGMLPITNLRVVFEIERNCFSAANKGFISIYNLNDISRRTLGLPSALIALSVGYGLGNGAPPPLFPIYAGNIWSVTNDRHGADMVSKVEIAENGAQLGGTTCHFTFPIGTTNVAVISALIASMGLVQGPTIGLTPVPCSGVYEGSPKRHLDQLLSAQKLTWHAFNNVVWIHPANLSPNPAPVFVSEQSGLIGVPNLTQPQGAAQSLTFKTLINPQIFPGSTVILSSRLFVTTLIVKTIKYEGDTHGNKWTQTCECSQINPITSLQGPPGP